MKIIPKSNIVETEFVEQSDVFDPKLFPNTNLDPDQWVIYDGGEVLADGKIIYPDEHEFEKSAL